MAATTAAVPVDTGKVGGRRTVSYKNHDEVLADVERLAAGGYRQLGNWSLGQIAGHLALAMTMALDGSKSQMAWPIRFLARAFAKNQLVRGPMKPGFKVPSKFSTALIPDPDLAADVEGISSLRTAVKRWKTEPQRHPHFFLGKLTPEEWEKILLNHAAMHLSFVVPN